VKPVALFLERFRVLQGVEDFDLEAGDSPLQTFKLREEQISQRF